MKGPFGIIDTDTKKESVYGNLSTQKQISIFYQISIGVLDRLYKDKHADVSDEIEWMQDMAGHLSGRLRKWGSVHADNIVRLMNAARVKNVEKYISALHDFSVGLAEE